MCWRMQPISMLFDSHLQAISSDEFRIVARTSESFAPQGLPGLVEMVRLGPLLKQTGSAGVREVGAGGAALAAPRHPCTDRETLPPPSACLCGFPVLRRGRHQEVQQYARDLREGGRPRCVESRAARGPALARQKAKPRANVAIRVAGCWGKALEGPSCSFHGTRDRPLKTPCADSLETRPAPTASRL